MEFMKSIQGNKTILQYKAKFMEFARFAPHRAEDDKRKVEKFRRGLHLSIKTWMATLRLKTLADVIETTMVVGWDYEELLKDKNMSKKKNNFEGLYDKGDNTKVFNKKTLEENETCL